VEYVSTKVLGLLPGGRLLPQAERDSRRRGQEKIKLILTLIKVTKILVEIDRSYLMKRTLLIEQCLR